MHGCFAKCPADLDFAGSFRQCWGRCAGQAEQYQGKNRFHASQSTSDRLGGGGLIADFSGSRRPLSGRFRRNRLLSGVSPAHTVRLQSTSTGIPMTLCPIAIVVGCKKCPIFKICPGQRGDRRPAASASGPGQDQNSGEAPRRSGEEEEAVTARLAWIFRQGNERRTNREQWSFAVSPLWCAPVFFFSPLSVIGTAASCQR